MAGFGDNSTCFMRSASLIGGLRIEAGCYTQQTADATAHIPTQLTEIVAFVCGTAVPNEAACVSASFIKCGLAGTPSVMNYVAVGW